MNRSLGWIAGLGLGFAVLFFIAAALLSPDSFDNFPHLRNFDLNLGGDAGQSSRSGSRQWAWDGGDTLRVNIPADITLTPGGPPAVIVCGDQDAIQQINFSNGTLSGFDPSFSITGIIPEIQVELRGVSLHEIDLEGAGELKLGHLTQDRLSLRISGAGNISANDGQVGDLELNISGAGSARLANVAVTNAKVDISGAGSARISPSGDADITISGVGSVHLETKPKTLVTHVSGLGSVNGPGAH